MSSPGASLPYRDPWKQSFAQRLQRLRRGPFRVAYYYHAPNASTFRYRVYNMIQALGYADPTVSASYFCESELGRTREILATIDVLVICRAQYDARIAELILSAQQRGVRVLFDVDDFVFDSDYVHLLMHTLEQDFTSEQAWDHWFSYVARIGATLRCCDGVIVTNDFLAREVRRFSQKPTYVVPNFLNDEQIAISEQLNATKLARPPPQPGQRITLGYFSGTPTHNRDFDLISDALARLLHCRRELKLCLVGFIALRGPLLAHTSQIETLPLTDFMNLQRHIAAADINLVPLQNNTFTNCKSELKYFEAAAVGTPSLVSPTHVFTACIDHGVSGYISPAYLWEQRLEEILKAPLQRAAAGQEARRQVLGRYRPRQQYSAMMAAFAGHSAPPAPIVADPNDRSALAASPSQRSLP